MFDGKYKWIDSYARPCTRGEKENLDALLRKKTFAYLGGDFSRERVREHFLTIHNEATLREAMRPDYFHTCAGVAHLALPYKVIQRGDSHFFCDLPDSVKELPIQPHKVLHLEDLNYAMRNGVLE